MGSETSVCIITVEVDPSSVGSFIKAFEDIESSINETAYVKSAVLTVPPTVHMDQDDSCLQVVVGQPERI